jgi:O-antigen/teichoic acid export membrane protein
MNIQFIKDITWFFFEHGLKTLVGLASTLLIINYLVPADYGLLSLALTTFAVLAAIASLGLDSVLLRKLIEKRSSKLISKSIQIRLIASIVITLAVIVVALYFDEVWLTLLMLLLVSLYFDSFIALREFAFSKKHYRLIVFANSSASIFQLLSVIILVKLESQLYWFVLPYILNRVTFISLLTFNQWQEFKFSLKNISDVEHPSLLKEGFPLMIAAIAGLAYAAQDQWMIAYFMTSDDVGIYAAAIKLVLMLIVIPTIITNILYHKIIALKESPEFKVYIQSIYSILFYIGATVYLALFILADWVINLAFPSTYAEASDVLKVYSLVLLMAFFQSLNNKLLILYNQQHLIMYRVLASLILNFLLNLYLIPKYGLIGAAFATVLSELFIIISYLINKKTRHIFWFQLNSFNPLNVFLLRKVI